MDRSKTMAEVDNSVRLQMNESEVRKSSVRQTPLTSFGETFQRGLATSVNTVGNAASSAGYMIPGAAVVGAAISGVGTVRSSNGGLSSVSPGSTGLVASTGAAGAGIGSVGSTSTLAGSTLGTGSGSAASLAASGNYTGAVATNAASGDASSQLMMATQQMQEMNQNFNLQYLQLQEHMQQDSREFTAMSNVIKTKSDTAKNSLSNLK
jgi:hypothetical protein